MNYILFDDKYSEQLLPFTYTRPVGSFLVGIWTLREKWEYHLGRSVSFKPYRTYLQGKFPEILRDDNVYINGAAFPTEDLLKAIFSLGLGEMLTTEKRVMAVRSGVPIDKFEVEALDAAGYRKRLLLLDTPVLNYPEDVFRLNGDEIKKDFKHITGGRKTAIVDETNRLINPEQIFIEPGAKICCAVINASNGPVYIGKESEVMEGAIIKGPFSLGAHSTIKMGAKIYGDSSFGPHCKVGGEVTNSVIFGYSNKGHDGYMGNSVIGEWCNWGADTNNSNLKNNYEMVKLWDYPTGRFRSTGLQFAGLMMADHAKCGINTMFNTGTVVGVGANIFGSGFPRNFLPSFCWGGAQGIETFRFNKFCQTAQKVMERRGIPLDELELQILKAVYDETSAYRSWEFKEKS
jgi:UDP-N-acetylglucosamine diphosphorylase/glucosamine-1-phosphate N-acetyltransferase